MASYTIQVQSAESSADFYWTIEHSNLTDYHYEDKKSAQYNFNLPNLAGTEIKSISITAPVDKTYVSGGNGNFALKLGSTTLASWTDSTTTTWSASNLSIAGKQGDSIKLELDPTTKSRNIVESGSRWYMTIGRRLGRATVTVIVEGEFAESTIYPISGENIPKSLENTFSWSQTIVQGSVVQQSLFWKQMGDPTYTEIVLNPTDTTYTFAPFTFSNGEIQWYLKATDNTGNVATSPIETVTVGIVPLVAISYPNNINIRNGNIQIFTWEMSESIATGQKSFEIQYKAESDAAWTTVIDNVSDQYCEFPENTFKTDDYVWKLKVTNNDDISTDYVTSSFHSIGSTDAPNIVNITNSSIPTITWEIGSQDTFELEIFANEERIYSSGVEVGAGIRSFTPNIMLEDGNYIVKMRAMNEFGYFTQWSDYSFVLKPPKPQEVECIAYANEYHGVNIELGLGNPSRLYVIKRKRGETEWNILGKLVAGETYTDNTIMTDVKYEYALRNYEPNAGFTDSNIVSMIINHKGSLIYKGNEFVELYETEDEQFDITHTPSKTYSYSYTIGRKYPIRESSEWMSHNTTLSCFVKFEEYKKLEEFYESNEDLWFKGDNFSFKCSIDSIQIKETLFGKGYSLGISLSRTDENEVILIEQY